MKLKHFTENHTQTQQNWIVAQALGWKGSGPDEGPWFDQRGHPQGKIPDYVNDLNAAFSLGYSHVKGGNSYEAHFIIENGGVKSQVGKHGAETTHHDGTVTITEDDYNSQGFCTVGDTEEDARTALATAMCIAFLKRKGVIEVEGCC